ncbi:MAG: heavy-metal-associated domain-containing protein [Clostridia bacterium]|nr:heavy-metal-associated domain-containing protein [Clostridia bacterium]
MVEITLKIEGMMCGMCESHLNEAVRAALPVKSVASSRKTGETVIVAKEDIPDEELRRVIGGTGYELKGITRRPYEKKGLFSFFKR